VLWDTRVLCGYEAGREVLLEHGVHSTQEEVEIVFTRLKEEFRLGSRLSRTFKAK